MELEFSKYPTNEAAKAVPVDVSFEPSEEDLETIVEICNEPLVYDFLFKKRLAGKAYSVEDAQGFISWAKSGWQNKAFFVFLVRDSAGSIVGCMDIKAKREEDSETEREIGYWATSKNPGFMTNAVKSLQDFAKNSGLTKLYGLAVLDNPKSQSVMTRAGLSDMGQIERDGNNYRRFEVNLI